MIGLKCLKYFYVVLECIFGDSCLKENLVMLMRGRYILFFLNDKRCKFFVYVINFLNGINIFYNDMNLIYGLK